jgi:hypothetical protein
VASGLYDAVINGAAGFNRGLLSGLDVVANPVAGLLNTVSRADGGAGLGIKPNPMQRAGRSLGIGQGGSEGAAFLGSMAGQIPVASDVMGLAQDIEAMRSGEMPVSPLTVGLTGIGLLPFVPSASRFLMDKLPGGHEPRVGDQFGANERGMLTYHGTPHEFPPTENNPLGEFDLSKMGTGEGAQAYGHGTYLAETPAVAEGYKNAITFAQNPDAPTDLMRYMSKGQELSTDVFNSEVMDDVIAQGYAATKDDYARRIARLADAGVEPSAYGDGFKLKHLKSKAADLETIGDVDISKEPIGSLYTVDLPDEHIANMLDWDAPLSEQPEGVRMGLQAIADANPRVLDDPIGLPKQVREFGTPDEAKEFWDFAKSEWLSTSNKKDRFKPRLLSNRKIEYYPPSQQAFGDATGGEILESLRRTTGEDSFISSAMNNAGIPGLKYFDGSSRSAGEGTRNFVLFDPSIASIIGRNGLLAK